MSVDLSAYVAQIKAEVNPPGSDLFGGATDSEWTNSLIGAFWNARLDGFIVGWTENADGASPGIVTPRVPCGCGGWDPTQPNGVIGDYDPAIQPPGPTSCGHDLPRMFIQLVIFYAAITAVRGMMTNVKTQFKAQAGSVAVEQQQSATILRDVYQDLVTRRLQLYRVLSEQGYVRIGYIDGTAQREQNLEFGGGSWWLR